MPAARAATAADLEPMSHALARAFADDPVMAFVWPDAGRRPAALPRFFDYTARLHPGTVWTTDDHLGGAIWAPPGHWKTRTADIVRGVPLFLRLIGRRLPTALRLLATVEKAHPTEPHWYLATLGTDPAHQGRGVGSALLSPVLDRCDAEGLPAYLESSKEANIAFYARHGFETTGELTYARGPTIWPMWREPRQR